MRGAFFYDFSCFYLDFDCDVSLTLEAVHQIHCLTWWNLGCDWRLVFSLRLHSRCFRYQDFGYGVHEIYDLYYVCLSYHGIYLCPGTYHGAYPYLETYLCWIFRETYYSAENIT